MKWLSWFCVFCMKVIVIISIFIVKWPSWFTALNVHCMRLMVMISVFRVQVTVGDSVLRSVSIVIQVHCVGGVQVCLFGATGHQWFSGHWYRLCLCLQYKCPSAVLCPLCGTDVCCYDASVPPWILNVRCTLNGSCQCTMTTVSSQIYIYAWHYISCLVFWISESSVSQRQTS